MSKWDVEYLKLCKKILTEGVEVENRTGINTMKISDYNFDITTFRKEKKYLSRKPIDIEYIKENINKSLLSDLYDLSNINWNNIVYHSEKSFLIKACELWDIGIHSTKYIGILLKKDRTTIHKYLSH